MAVTGQRPTPSPMVGRIRLFFQTPDLMVEPYNCAAVALDILNQCGAVDVLAFGVLRIAKIAAQKLLPSGTGDSPVV